MAQISQTNILFAGVGGQGNILVSHLLADAALESGYQVLLTETFGAATRGGSVFSCVRIGDISAPLPREHSCQALVGLEPLEGLRLAKQYLSPGGWALMNTRPWYPIDVSAGRMEYPNIEGILEGIKWLKGKAIVLDATGIAQNAGSSRMMNIVLLGGLMALKIVHIDPNCLLAQMDRRWKANIADQNKIAFQIGYDQVSLMALASL